MKLHHFVQKMKKNTLKDGLYAKKDAKRDVKSNFFCSERSYTMAYKKTRMRLVLENKWWQLKKLSKIKNSIKRLQHTLRLCDIVERHHWCRAFQLWRSSQEEREGDYDQRIPIDKEEWCLGCDVETWREVRSVFHMDLQDLACSRWQHHGIQGKIRRQGFSWKEGIDYEETFAATRS